MVNIQYLEISKHIDIIDNYTNGDMQNKLLNMFNLSIYDIKYILYEYENKIEICGHDNSFYSIYYLKRFKFA